MSAVGRYRWVVIGACLAAVLTGCASGRVRGAQGTEMGQEREYGPETKVEPPIGNVERTSGSMTQPEAYPVLEVDLENSGATTVSRVTSVLSTTTPDVVVDDYKALWGTVPAATTQGSAAPHFTLSLDPGFVCGDPVDLRLDIRTAEEPRFCLFFYWPPAPAARTENMSNGPWKTSTTGPPTPWKKGNIIGPPSFLTK